MYKEKKSKAKKAVVMAKRHAYEDLKKKKKTVDYIKSYIIFENTCNIILSLLRNPKEPVEPGNPISALK